MTWAHLFFGAVLMLIGGDWLVRGTVGISRRLGLSEFIIAVVIIGIGTSMPELFVSIISDNRDLGTLVISNNISSNIVDIWGVIAIGAFLSPIILNGRKHMTDFVFVWVATLVFAAMCMFSYIGWIDGVILYSIFAAYLFYAVKNAKQNDAETGGQSNSMREGAFLPPLAGAGKPQVSERASANLPRLGWGRFGNPRRTPTQLALSGKAAKRSYPAPENPPHENFVFAGTPGGGRKTPSLAVGGMSVESGPHYNFLYDNALFRFFQNSVTGLVCLVLFGIGLVYLGSEVFMDSLQAIAAKNHLDQTLAGILIVGPGTSMPELIVTIIAAVRRRPQIAIGNILGSNLMNIALVIPTAAIFMDLPVTKHISHFDAWVMVAALAMLTLDLFVWKRISRWTSVLYMGLLAFYMWSAVVW
jgi:cation:H+ antiporter